MDGDFFQVQCLIFSKLDHMLENEIATPLCTVSGPGTYAIVHFMGLDVFGEPDNNMKLYGHMQKFFNQHEDCFLVCGWFKYTADIHRHIGNQENPLPILAVIYLDHFKRPVLAIEDHVSFYLPSWLFMPKRKCWADAFVTRMTHDVYQTYLDS